MGRLGGKKRSENLTAARRREIAQKAASARWRKKKKLDIHPIHKVVLADDSLFSDDRPTLVLYRAPGEKIIQWPDDILQRLKGEGIVQEGHGRARNPLTHGEHSFVVALAQNHESLIALSVALVPAIIAWLKSRKGRKIEIRKGNMKISAPTEKALDSALKSLAEYEKLTIMVKKSPKKRKSNQG